jgi:hypothetical protein
MMNAMQFDELTMVGIKRAIENSQEGGPQNAKFLRELFEDVTPQQIMEKVTPVYAKRSGPVCLNSFSRKISGAIAGWMCSGKHGNPNRFSLRIFFFADGGVSAA